MSYILRALRKSEAERAKGAIPKLTPHHEPVAPRQGSVWPWVAVAALVVNAVIGGAVLWRSDVMPWLREAAFGPDKPVVAETKPPTQPATQQVPTGKAATAAASPAATPEPDAEPQPSAPRAEPSEPQPPVQAPVVVQRAEAPDTATAPAAPPQKTETVATEAPAPASDSVESAKPPAAAAEVAESPETAARIVGAIEKKPSPKAALARPDPVEIVPMAPSPPRKPAEIENLPAVLAARPDPEDPLEDELPWDREPNGPDLAHADDDPLPPDFAEEEQAGDIYEGVPMLWQMPRSFRSRLPKLSISVHVYAPEEPGRFVIIDRKKYWEGDNLTDGVVLEAIVPDGVVMEYQGQQFRLSSR